MVQLWETRADEAKARAKEVEAKERQLDDFRQQRSPIVERFQHKAETLQETEEFTRMKGAQEQRRKAGLKRLDKEAARKVVDGIVDRIDRGRSVEEVVLDVERVELRGSLREFVVHGRPLKATMMVVVMGARREVAVDWGLGDMVGLVQGVVEAAWEVLGSEE